MSQPYAIQMLGSPPKQFIFRREDNATIPEDPNNMDYFEYQMWEAEGNTPDPNP
jgi:hypothetical protein